MKRIIHVLTTNFEENEVEVEFEDSDQEDILNGIYTDDCYDVEDYVEKLQDNGIEVIAVYDIDTDEKEPIIIKKE